MTIKASGRRANPWRTREDRREPGGQALEQRDLEIFLALVEELHFGRTAERLHVTTARVSQAIKQLQRRIGATLFERASRRADLMPIGRRLQDDLRPAVQQIQDGIDRAVSAARGVRGVLRVGASWAPPPKSPKPADIRVGWSTRVGAGAAIDLRDR